MTDIKEDIKNSPASATPQGGAVPTPAKTESPEEQRKHAHMSKGEKWYNRIVYSWLNYWTNLGISVYMAEKMTYGNWRKPMDWAIGKMAKTITKSGIAMEKAHHHTKVGMETLSLLSGGYLLLIPLKLMEDRKRPIVHWLNKTFFGGNAIAPDGHEETAEEIYIEKEQPHQSWWNVIKRRFLATAIVVGSGSVIDHVLADKTKKIDHAYPLDPYDPNTTMIPHSGHMGGKDWATGRMVGGANWALSHIPGGNRIIQNQKAQNWMSLAALDSIFTKITAMTMWLTRGAAPAKMPKEIGDDFDQPAVDTINEFTVQQPGEDPVKFAERVGRAKVSDKPVTRVASEALSKSFAHRVQQPSPTNEIGVGS